MKALKKRNNEILKCDYAIYFDACMQAQVRYKSVKLMVKELSL